MRKYQKWAAVFICIVFMGSSFLSFHFLAEHWEHELHQCSEDQCAICCQITSARTLLGSQKADSTSEKYLLPIFCVLAAAVQKAPAADEMTLIGQKVRMDC